MKNRELKFRAWDGKRMTTSGIMFNTSTGHIVTPETLSFNVDAELPESMKFAVMQFTGHQTADGVYIYESDIFRIEENAADLEQEDRIYYVVVCWVQEWSMFATLLIDEYHKYLSEGVKALDEPMFWTYNLRSTEDKGIYLCGNIYENPELLKPLTDHSQILPGIID